MSNQELFQALNMLQNSVKDVFTTRTINQAQEQVNQIKATETNEAKQRQALSGVANELTMRLAGLGTPATTIAQVAGAVGPKQFANSNQMNAEALLSGDQNLGQIAQKQQDFESNKAFELAKIRTNARAAAENDPFRQMKFEAAQEQYKDKVFTKLSETLDPNKEIRSAFGRAASAIQGSNSLEALIGSASTSLKEANKLPPNMVYELATGLAAMVKRGTPTQEEVAHFAPKTMGMDAAKFKQYMSNGIEGAEAGEFVQLYAKSIKRERAEMQHEVDETILQRAQGNIRAYKQDPTLFKRVLADRLKVPEEDIIVDTEKKLVTTAQRQNREKDYNLASTELKNAFAAMKSNDSAAKQKALQIFQALGVDPKGSYKQAQEDVKYRISRGLL